MRADWSQISSGAFKRIKILYPSGNRNLNDRSPKRCAFSFSAFNRIKKVVYTPVQALWLRTGRTAHRVIEVQLYPFMITALEGGEGSASLPDRSLTPGKNRYPLYRRLGGPQGRSGQVRKISPPHRDSIPGPSSP